MGVPIYERPCELCAKRRIPYKGGGVKCADCGRKIAGEGVPPSGFQSATYDHEHLISVEGQAGKQVATRALCKRCFKKDWKKKYPDGDWDKR